MFSIKNLSKSYSENIKKGIHTSCEIKPESGTDNAHLAVENVNLEIKKGEILAILGENGSGKSTLLKMMAGLLEPSSGEIILDKKKVLGPSSKLVAGHENIKLIHQNYNLQPNISLEENIKYHLRFFNDEYKTNKTEYLIQLCHLEEVRHKLPRQTSGGEQQRTAIACALSTPTDVLLLDEPFSNLDIFNSEILKRQMVSITKKEKIYTIFVTHDAEDALSVSQNLAVIQNGNVVQYDTPQNIYINPINEYVAQITGLSTVFKQKDLLELFHIQSNSKKTYLRPENFQVSETGIDAKVQNCSFRGGRYLVSAKILNTKVKILLYTSHYFEEETVFKVKLTF